MATFKIVLYKSKTLKDGSHPVMLQIVEDRKPFRISLGYNAHLNEWDEAKCRFKRNKENYKAKNEILREKEIQAEKTLDTIQLQNKPVTPTYFKEIFLKDKKNTNVFEFIDELCQDFNSKGKAGTSNTYRDTRNALLKFTSGKKNLYFTDIDYTFLDKFETHLFSRGCTGGGISVYMRTLKAIINKAIKQGYLDNNLYPFRSSINRNGYSPEHLKSKASPRALSLEDIEKFKNFESSQYPHLQFSHTLFLFSYYARGMNFKDMAQLKWSDLYDNKIHYTRDKTGAFFSIGISENIKSIFEGFQKDSPYIFPILSDFHKTPIQIKNRLKKCLRKFNSDLKEIAETLDISTNVTSYVARHTFANTLKKNKANIGLISQAMGHSDIKITNAYLKNFEDSELDELDKLL
ncbi:MAG: site-specific integrase [Saprospiraceae bacterium]